MELLLAAMFSAASAPRSLCAPTVHALVETSLRGVDSHGVRLAPHYVREILAGRINLAPSMALRQTSPTTATLDADHTFGTAAATSAMESAIEMATGAGVGIVAVTNSTHFGAAAVYALMAARRGMIGISLTNTDALVLPHGGLRAFLGTNPICVAAPCAGEEPFCLDMATSAVAWNRVRKGRLTGELLEPGWAADEGGSVTTNPQTAAALFPLGGYKGYGLGFVVELLCSLLTGMPSGPDIVPMYPATSDKRYLGHFVMAIDISRFSEPAAFAERVREIVHRLRAEPAAADAGVMVANDPEKAAFAERSVNGIPLDAADVEALREAAALVVLDPSALTCLMASATS